MDKCLTQTIQVDLPIWRKYSSAPVIPGFTDITSITPILETFLTSTPTSEGQLNSDDLFGRIIKFDASDECVIETVGRKKIDCYCKISHLLDPIRTLQDFYENPDKGVRRRDVKLTNPMNQAYVDTLANYLLGQLRQRKISPHFCLFYGGFKGIANTYRYNISDEFESYRKYKDFWQRRRDGKFKLYVDCDDESVKSEDKGFFKTPDSSMRSTPFSYRTPSDSRSSQSTDRTHISLAGDNTAVALDELESVSSFKSGSSSSSESESESESTENPYSVYAQFEKYPTMLIFQEKMEGVLDDLLEAVEDSEKRWTAWTFQIIAALCAAQGVLGFTHNDLHTNNIVWAETEETWLFYKSRDGTVWRVPTYGKIFRIIDFGRAIFRVGEKWFISDDYEEGGDADSQYNFGASTNPKEPIVYPNPSFDLCRYAVSVIEALYPEMPVENLDGNILSSEDDWIIHDTVSPLWNLLWSWLIDTDGKNVLRDEDGTERFPDFDLYEHISKSIFSAKPQEQIHKDIFSEFVLKGNDANVGDWETVYPLFC
jgi:hypothetical protein